MESKQPLAREDYQKGMKYKDIAKKYGVSMNTVKSWKTRHKWKKGARKKTESECAQKKRTQQVAAKIVRKIINEDSGLTENQQLFCVYFSNNRNATQSYLKVHNCTYLTAAVESSRLLRNPKVQRELKRLKKIKMEAIMLEECDIVERYMRIAFSDMTDVADFGTRQVPVLDPIDGRQLVDGNGELIFRTETYLSFKNANQVDGCLIKEVKTGRSGQSIKIADSLKALAWLSEYFELNPMNKHRKRYDEVILALREKELKLKEW